MPPNSFVALRQATPDVSIYSVHPHTHCFQSLGSCWQPDPPLCTLAHPHRLSRQSRRHRRQAESNQAPSGGRLRRDSSFLFVYIYIILSYWVDSFKEHKNVRDLLGFWVRESGSSTREGLQLPARTAPVAHGTSEEDAGGFGLLSFFPRCRSSTVSFPQNDTITSYNSNSSVFILNCSFVLFLLRVLLFICFWVIRQHQRNYM